MKIRFCQKGKVQEKIRDLFQEYVSSVLCTQEDNNQFKSETISIRSCEKSFSIFFQYLRKYKN